MNGWAPLRKLDPHEINPEMSKIRAAVGIPPSDEVWVNSRYQVVVDYQSPEDGRAGAMHLSLHTHDRGPMRNWRHLQQIKNEVAGEERWAVEVFPPESKLADTSNEYHLWVMPEGTPLVIGFNSNALVSTDEQAEAYNDAPHKGRQELWEPGLTTGRVGHEGSDLLDLPGGEVTPDDMRRKMEGGAR